MGGNWLIKLFFTCFWSKKTRALLFYLHTNDAKQLDQHALLDHNWKYIVDETGEHIFDLSVDEGERNNLITTKPAKAEDLKKKYKSWEQLVLTPLPLQ